MPTLQVETYNETMVRLGLAALVSVPPSRVVLTMPTASVRLRATIMFGDASEAACALSMINDTDISTFGKYIHLDVESNLQCELVVLPTQQSPLSVQGEAMNQSVLTMPLAFVFGTVLFLLGFFLGCCRKKNARDDLNPLFEGSSTSLETEPLSMRCGFMEMLRCSKGVARQPQSFELPRVG